MVDRIKSVIEVHASAKQCYDRWHDFENFPHFMNRIKRVISRGDNRWHWIITTPVGRDIEWDAVIDSDERNRNISWHTIDHPDVNIQGTVRFDEIAPKRTNVICTMQYQVEGSPIREAFAEMFNNPQAMVNEEMLNFKHLVEGTNVPAEKVTHGKTLNEQTFKGDNPDLGYVGPYDLEEALAADGVEVENIEDPAIRDMIFEENPYLGVEGAWEEEDEWPKTDEDRPVELDAFSESMDVFDEDLESFTEGLDDDIDSAFVTGDSIEEFEAAQETQSPRGKRVESEL